MINQNLPAMPGGEIILYQTEDGQSRIEVRLEDESVWLTQAALAELFQTTSQNITLHLKNIFDERELEEDATCKEYLQVHLYMRDWREKLDAFLKFNERDLLEHAGKVSMDVAQTLALQEYEKFRARRLAEEAEAEALADDDELKRLEAKIEKKRKGKR